MCKNPQISNLNRNVWIESNKFFCFLKTKELKNALFDLDILLMEALYKSMYSLGKILPIINKLIFFKVLEDGFNVSFNNIKLCRY